MTSDAKGVVVPASIIVRCRQREAFHRRAGNIALSQATRDEHNKTADLLDDIQSLFTNGRQ
jgi:hypothetical protein